jgi:hypothetical protein
MPSDKKFPDLVFNEDGTHNYEPWKINAKAELRPKKLWIYTQNPLAKNAPQTQKDKHVEAAD